MWSRFLLATPAGQSPTVYFGVARAANSPDPPPSTCRAWEAMSSVCPSAVCATNCARPCTHPAREPFHTAAHQSVVALPPFGGLAYHHVPNFVPFHHWAFSLTMAYLASHGGPHRAVEISLRIRQFTLFVTLQTSEAFCVFVFRVAR